MECSACMGTCGGECKVCSGSCGGGKPVVGVLSGHPHADPGSTLEEVILGHFKMGHTLEQLLTHENGAKVTFNLFWSPSAQEVARLNKIFMTFRFHKNGTLSAVRGRQFARDAEVLLKMLKHTELEGY